MFLDKADWLGLLVFVLVQFIGSYVDIDRDEYNRASKKVKGAPPGWVFGPVWVVLKFMRGIAGFIYWNEGPTTLGTLYNWTLAFYVIIIILDVQWLPLFFGNKNAGAAFVVVLFIDLLTIAVAIFVAIGAVGGSSLWISFAFFLVYLAWIGYATYLNAQWFFKGIWKRLEREDKESLPMPATQEQPRVKKSKGRKSRKTTSPPLPSLSISTQLESSIAMKMPGKHH